jgi:hypothetical protein
MATGYYAWGVGKMLGIGPLHSEVDRLECLYQKKRETEARTVPDDGTHVEVQSVLTCRSHEHQNNFDLATSTSPSSILHSHGLVGVQKPVIESHRPACKPQTLGIREIADTLVPQIFPDFVQDVQIPLVKSNRALLAGRNF